MSKRELTPDVSIHAPVQGATKPSLTVFLKGWMFQSTPPCRGRHDLDGLVDRTGRVSIHAPVQGATGRRFETARRSRVSIHAPVQGAT